MFKVFMNDYPLIAFTVRQLGIQLLTVKNCTLRLEKIIGQARMILSTPKKIQL
jgi:hypothetical protein